MKFAFEDVCPVHCAGEQRELFCTVVREGDIAE